jgi:hypothetical protein
MIGKVVLRARLERLPKYFVVRLMQEDTGELPEEINRSAFYFHQ